MEIGWNDIRTQEQGYKQELRKMYVQRQIVDVRVETMDAMVCTTRNKWKR